MPPDRIGLIVALGLAIEEAVRAGDLQALEATLTARGEAIDRFRATKPKLTVEQRARLDLSNRRLDAALVAERTRIREAMGSSDRLRRAGRAYGASTQAG